MEKLLIGSQALKNLYPEFKRIPKDTDYAVDVPYIKSSDKQTEYLYNPLIIEHCTGKEIDGDSLLTLKVSHLFWDINWDKHLFDTLFLMERGHTINYPLLNKLREFWNEWLPKIRRSDLEMNKENFFSNAVNEDTDEHDHLHTILNPVPMYTRLLKDNSEVELDEEKWHKLTEEEKDAVVWEETCVMAYERMKHLYYKVAFLRQLKDNIIKHFPQYIAIHAITNYKRIHVTNINFINLINNGINKN